MSENQSRRRTWPDLKAALERRLCRRNDSGGRFRKGGEAPLRGSLAGPAAFAVLLVAVFVGMGELITRISAEGERPSIGSAALGVLTPEAGEAIFWGKGKCSTCHAVGARGNAIRGPNQGAEGPLGLPIARRAEARAAERARATGRPYTATAYLVESLVDPGAYVVDGYKNEMPNPLRPPISLGIDEVKAVVLYLQSLGGTPEPSAIRIPPEAEALARSAPTPDRSLTSLLGDPGRGRRLFFDADSNAACAKCHRVGEVGGAVGPELTHIAGTRDLGFIVESIVDPSRTIASGYEAVLVVTKRGQYVTGIVRRETADELEIVDSGGRSQKVAKRDIDRRAPQRTSLMPENFRDILTVGELGDLLAYLSTLR